VIEVTEILETQLLWLVPSSERREGVLGGCNLKLC
jgi:hypothetical protein